MGFLDKASLIRSAKDMASVAREFVAAMNQIKIVNQDLQKYIKNNAAEVPLELHDLILQMDRAVSLL
jgi:hypothetical protein